ncbi:MAG: hypothetical protein ACTSQU_01920 [Promethearchaeota archaeon]
MAITEKRKEGNDVFEQNYLNRGRIKLSELNRGRNPMLAQIIVLNFPSYK